MIGDWIQGLNSLTKYYGISFQLCIIYMQMGVKHTLSSKPKTEAGMQLIMIAGTLHYISKNDFKELLDMFYERYENYLKERSYDNYSKWHYKHRKLRRAYFSMRRNIELLFEFEMTKNIPKHNNSIEASFGD